MGSAKIAGVGAVEVEARPAIPHWRDIDARRLMDFSIAASRVRALSAQIKALEEEKRELASELEAELVSRDLKSLRGDEWTVTRTTQEKKSLKPELLVQQGVSLKVIEKATVVTEVSYVTVRERRDDT